MMIINYHVSAVLLEFQVGFAAANGSVVQQQVADCCCYDVVMAAPCSSPQKPASGVSVFLFFRSAASKLHNLCNIYHMLI
jgi:hypothetical protein